MRHVEGHNRHHCISPRFKYKYPVAKEFREHPFLVNLVQERPHARYHAENDHPLLLSREQMLGCLGMMQELATEPLEPSERIHELAEYLDGRSSRESRVAGNLFKQALFVEEFGFRH